MVTSLVTFRKRQQHHFLSLHFSPNCLGTLGTLQRAAPTAAAHRPSGEMGTESQRPSGPNPPPAPAQCLLAAPSLGKVRRSISFSDLYPDFFPSQVGNELPLRDVCHLGQRETFLALETISDRKGEPLTHEST